MTPMTIRSRFYLLGIQEEGATWVIPMLAGQPSKNLGTTFKKIIRHAGVEVWPKPFQNLRSSRRTELEQDYPTYVVCRWLDNTPSVALKHYLTVTDDHHQKAVQNGGLTGDSRGINGGRNRPFCLAWTRKKKPAPLMKCGKTLVFRKLWTFLKMPEWRGQDSNLRPRGYEPRELPDCSPPRHEFTKIIGETHHSKQTACRVETGQHIFTR